MNTAKAYRTMRRIHRANRAVQDPAQFAKNRAKSKALGALGFWRLMAWLWRS